MYLIDRTIHRFNSEWQASFVPGRVSVVIPVHAQNGPLAAKAAKHALAQGHPDLEILVSNNGIDPTFLEKSFRDEGVEVRFVHAPKNFGASYARNAGATPATGEFLWFVDCDIIGLAPATLDFMLAVLRNNPDVGAIGGQLQITPEGKLLALGRFGEHGGDAAIEQYRMFEDEYVNTTCMLIRRRDFGFLQGFSDVMEFMHEDADLGFRIRRLGLSCIVDYRAVALHPPTTSPLDEPDRDRHVMVYKNVFLYYLFNLRLINFLRFLSMKRNQARKARAARAGMPGDCADNAPVGPSVLRDGFYMFRALCSLVVRIHRLVPLLIERRNLFQRIDREREARGLSDRSGRYVLGREETWQCW